FIFNLVKQSRDAIISGDFESFRLDFINKYKGD
ncbi:unnamed protein product, partial [marine sediment metagenome]